MDTIHFLHIYSIHSFTLTLVVTDALIDPLQGRQVILAVPDLLLQLFPVKLRVGESLPPAQQVDQQPLYYQDQVVLAVKCPCHCPVALLRPVLVLVKESRQSSDVTGVGGLDGLRALGLQS